MMFEIISIFDILSLMATGLLIPVWVKLNSIYVETRKLRSEHDQICKTLEKIQERQERDNDVVGTAINDLQREHNQHNEVQAKILQLCEIVERRNSNG